jgi:RNA polymerase sigma-70 factor, ECF subfamily
MRTPRLRNPAKRLQALPDEALVSLAGEGQSQAFGVLYDRHSSAAFGLAYRIVGTRGGAEAVLQEAFLALWRSCERYDDERGSVRTFLLSIVRNRAIDALRRDAPHERRRGGHDEVLATLPSEEHTEGEVERRDRAARVRGALAELPDDQRRVIELAYFSGFTHTEIGAMLELPLGTVKGRMRLGLEKLRTALGPSAAEAWT